jgi:hypothetical protein
MVQNFYKKFFQTIRGQVNVKGFLIQELLKDKEEFFKNYDKDSDANKKCCSGVVDRIKLGLMQIIIEGNILKKLFDDYEECLQIMAAIDRDIKLLGHEALLMD